MINSESVRKTLVAMFKDTIEQRIELAEIIIPAEEDADTLSDALEEDSTLEIRADTLIDVATHMECEDALVELVTEYLRAVEDIRKDYE